MDLEDWELLPDDDGGKMVFSRKYTNNDFNMNYFICPCPKSSQFVDSTEHPQIVPFPIQLEPSFQETTNDHEVITIKNILPSKNICDNSMMEADQVSSQVFFKKMKENMKLDSPKSNNKTLLSQVDADPFQFEEQAEVLEVDKEMVINKIGMEAENREDNNSAGINLLNKSLNGIGAICSFAAATICIIFMGNHQNNKQNQQKRRFQIFSNDKRIKQVVHHATKLNNEAIAAVRGVPVTRAHITVGGYYDAL
ncbi:uncharacterized protein LOC107797772 [Nicotiana tabacum]|uniref:Uncharacterized protein LOC107797772 n=1 Tax=Nicotiana tabacum TaxID=4097 RepID=A0A1S4AIB9_TOBAC|nr:uncharacterized protein LOC104103128 [Nicotiana tomentosiformis]XP_016476183.1 PREDICTED: uncharacterized protein LOC107797772 [Nicotiana tabacum]